MSEPIICPLWEPNDKRFRSRHYHAWDRRCGLCDRAVVVSDAVKRQLESDAGASIICEQCDLIRTPESETTPPNESWSGIADAVETCPTCATLKEQEEAAAKELARCEGLPDVTVAMNARKKWESLSHARWAHRFAKPNLPRHTFRTSPRICKGLSVGL